MYNINTLPVIDCVKGEASCRLARLAAGLPRVPQDHLPPGSVHGHHPAGERQLHAVRVCEVAGSRLRYLRYFAATSSSSSGLQRTTTFTLSDVLLCTRPAPSRQEQREGNMEKGIS